MFKRGMSIILAAALVLGGICTRPALALAGESEADEHNTDVLEMQAEASTPGEAETASTAQGSSPMMVFYNYDYEYQWSFPDNWRNGVSGGSKITDITLTFDRGYDEHVNINFTAEIAGDIMAEQGKIGAHFGVSFGESKGYSLDSGVNVVVPKGHHYTIRYRPIVAVYKVTEYLQLTRANAPQRAAKGALAAFSSLPGVSPPASSALPSHPLRPFGVQRSFVGAETVPGKADDEALLA